MAYQNGSYHSFHYLFSGANNVLIKARWNDTLKSNHPSKVNRGILCEKGNYICMCNLIIIILIKIWKIEYLWVT